MFKNASLQIRFFAAFLFIGLIVFAVAFLGWSTNQELSKYINTLSTNSLPSVIGLWKVNEGQTQIESSERALLNVELTQIERKAEIARIKRAWEQIDEGYKQYDATDRTNEEAKLYDQIKIKWAEWKKSHEKYLQINQEFERLGILNPTQRLLDLTIQDKKPESPEILAAKKAQGLLDQVIQGKKPESPEILAAKKAKGLLDQLIQQAQDNRPLFEAATASLLQDIAYNEQFGLNVADKGIKQSSSNSFWLIVALAIGPLTAIIFGYYFTNSTIPKIVVVVKVAEKISTGDLSNSLQMADTQDEIGKLQNAFYQMSKNLKNLIQQVQKSGILITTSTTQIAASGKQLEATMTEQVASTNEVAATARSIATNSAQLLKTIDEVEHEFQETAKATGSSQQELIHMEQSMTQLANATTIISTKLGVINEKANSINSIITTITKVADQTNLLSLNAAIEAEKAGEYGTGFAVVAREIRRLADQSAVATLDIENMVKDMQSAVSTGVMEVDKFAQEVTKGVNDVRHISAKLESIIQRVQNLTPSFQNVSNSMQGQSEGAVQISEAMMQLSEASSQTAQSLRDVNGAISQLNNAAQTLHQEISRFKVDNN